MASILFRVTQLLSLVAILDGKRVKNKGTKKATLTPTNGEATPLKVEVPPLSSSKSGCVLPPTGTSFSNRECSDDGWYKRGNECCKGDSWDITCQKGTINSCQKDSSAPSWKYLGNSQCCTTDWAQCMEADINKCDGDGYQYLGNKLCCLTTPKRAFLTCYNGDINSCDGAPWKYLGDQKCCTKDYAHCEEGADINKCDGDEWKYMGKGTCCTTSSYSYPQVTCNIGSDSRSCESGRGKYLGNGKCCYLSKGYNNGYSDNSYNNGGSQNNGGSYNNGAGHYDNSQNNGGSYNNGGGSYNNGGGSYNNPSQQHQGQQQQQQSKPVESMVSSTKDYRFFLPGFDAASCKGDWKKVGSNCVTNYGHCEEGTTSTDCQGDWKYFGSGKCCTASQKKPFKIPCVTGIDSRSCAGHKGSTYLGNGKCCGLEW